MNVDKEILNKICILYFVNVDINECEILVSFCQFGGICNNIDGFYYCICLLYRGGDYCEISKYSYL